MLDTAAVDALAASVGPIDILFNCAGYVHHGTVLEMLRKDWDFSFDLNVKSMHRTIRASCPACWSGRRRAANRGSIVNVASGASSVRGIPNRYAYGASKAAVIGLTKAVAADFIKKGVRCNAICPGTVRSPSWEERVEALGRDVGSKEKALEMFVARQPMGRVGEPDEIAAVAVHLAGDESAFTTGIIISADGGFSL